MVKKYSLLKDGAKTLSLHFKVKEFASIAGNEITTDEILISDKLVAKLEALIKLLGATKAVITSGYRDARCDKLVGGTGSGQHVNGNAADVIFYKGSKTVDTKLVSCKAQDLGFGGIARISNTATHLDVRTGSKYYGDETKSKRTVTDDFYKYYKISRSNEDIKKVCDKFGLSNDFWQKNYDTDLGRENILELFTKIAKKL